MTVFKVTSGGVAPGSYYAKFVGIEPAPPRPDMPDGIRWKWQLQSGETASRITTSNPTMRNACGKVLSGIIGKPITDGEEHDITAFIGKTYLVIVVACEGGGTRVETVSAPPVG